MARGPARFAYGETRMLTEYLAFEYPNDNVFERMRLGGLDPAASAEGLDPEELVMLGVFRRWADAVVIRRDELVLIEAKMRSAPGAVAQLLLYDELVPLTPELADYRSLPRRLELVVAVDDPAVRRMAERQGVRVKVFRPAWLPEWTAAMHRREGRPPRDFASAAGGSAQA